jgi:single-strand DNA-binding protein
VLNRPTISFSGNLAAKPELRTVETTEGTVVAARLRVAVTPRRRDRGTDAWSDDETLWFSVSTWRYVAQNCVLSLDQGDRVVVRGHLTQRTWTDDRGAEHVVLEVAADDVSLDLSRGAAMSLRKKPQPRRTDATGDDDVATDAPEPPAAEVGWAAEPEELGAAAG